MNNDYEDLFEPIKQILSIFIILCIIIGYIMTLKPIH